jgi:outer membrane protein assembly factor BamD (BamD/ComL family)
LCLFLLEKNQIGGTLSTGGCLRAAIKLHPGHRRTLYSMYLPLETTTRWYLLSNCEERAERALRAFNDMVALLKRLPTTI